MFVIQRCVCGRWSGQGNNRRSDKDKKISFNIKDLVLGLGFGWD